MNRKPQQTAPELQLSQAGETISFGRLLKATKSLSNRDLQALEEDLELYSQTGFVGLHLSRLLAMLLEEQAAVAA